MNTREFIFANFRNLGKANESTTLFLNAGLGTMEGFNPHHRRKQRWQNKCSRRS